MRYYEIPGYPGYLINEYGVVINERFDCEVKQQVNDRGYYYVNLLVGRRQKILRIHRGVALALIPNPDQKPEVNHIDSDKSNNHVSNLEWVTSKENKEHAIRSGRFSSSHRRMSIRVIETGEIFESQSACALALGIAQPHISQQLNGIRTHAKGYTFERI